MATTNTNTTADLDKKLIDIRVNIYNAIKLHRNDIIVALINEWYKFIDNFIENKKSDINSEVLSEYKYFFNLNYCDNQTKTPLHVAYELLDYDIIRTLLNFGANPGIKDVSNNKTLTKLILESNNHTLKQILTDCLLQAIAQNNLFKINQLINSGIDINNNDDLIEKNSYLHWAVLYSTEDVIKYLLDNGANVNIQNKNGSTPLHDAVYKRKNANIIEILLLYKANVNLKANDGIYKDKTPLDLSENDKNMHSLLIDYINETNSDLIKTPPSTPTTSSSTKLNSTTFFDSQPNTIVNNNDNNTIAKNASINSANSSSSEINNLNSNEINKKDDLFEAYCNFCTEAVINSNNNNNDDAKNAELFNLLWPKPQIIRVNDINNYFRINDKKTFYIYIKSPNTYKYIDFINRLVSVYSDIKFIFIHKPINIPHITVTIDSNLFHIENSYSILIQTHHIQINSYDITGLQYALCTFLQLCKIYSNTNDIPEIKVDKKITE